MKTLTQAEIRRKNAALTIVKTLSEETSIIAKPLSSIDIKNIPNSVEPAIKNWIRKYKGKSEVYGSAAMATHSIHARRPQDLDIVIDNPSHAAHILSELMRQRGIKTKIVANSEWGSYVVQVNIKGEWKDALDIHPIKDHYGKYEFYGSSKPPIKKKGINLQRASDQLLRKFNAITQCQKDGSMGAAPHREIKDTIDAIQITELLLASMELKSKAEIAKAKKVREELKIWKTHLRTLQKGKKSAVKREPLSATRQKKFIAKVVKETDKDIDDLIFENGKVILRKTSLSKTIKMSNKRVVVNPYYGITESPYQQKKEGQRRKKKITRVPYDKILKATHSFSETLKR